MEDQISKAPLHPPQTYGQQAFSKFWCSVLGLASPTPRRGVNVERASPGLFPDRKVESQRSAVEAASATVTEEVWIWFDRS